MNDLTQDWGAHRRIKLTVDDFERLAESGAFDRYPKTELIDGDVLAVNAQHRPHAFIKTELAFRLRVALATLGSDLLPLMEASVAIPPHDVPEPDIVLTREPKGRGFVPLASVALVVEVAATTMTFDMGEKRRLYAKAGVPEYWVVDVEGHVVRQMWGAQDGAYSNKTDVPFGTRIEAATTPGLAVATDGLD